MSLTTDSWHEFGDTDCLKNALDLSPLPFRSDDTSFVQLRYIERYAADLGCGSFAVESHYIDRDYIEDHSAFYSKNLYPYSNSCRRVHFFKGTSDEVKECFKSAVDKGRSSGIESYRQECKNISDSQYLGFSVIKHLKGTPVGRTVMKCFEAEPPGKDYKRQFSCTKKYVVHFCGCELSVNGLAFQQQDIGVSACATTALWSALQKTADVDPIAAMTPVQITRLATQYSLPSGRPLPSEGLDIAQMCSAVQASGASPNLFRVNENNVQARYILRAAILSGFAPVLAMEHTSLGGHAVVAVGLKEKFLGDPLQIHFHEHSVTGLYIHDDRLGPNLRCNYRRPDSPNKPLGLNIELRDSGDVEEWELRYVLVPMHPKIRLSFANVKQLAADIVTELLALHTRFIEQKFSVGNHPLGFDIQILRCFKYVEKLIVEENGIDTAHIGRICTNISPARYLAVIRVNGPFFSQFDLLIDSTGTITNPHYLAVIPTESASDGLKMVGRYIAHVIGCPYVD